MIMDVADKKGGLPNFKGAMIGDGCYGNSIGLCGNRHYEQATTHAIRQLLCDS